jgi:hypothetical protein
MGDPVDPLFSDREVFADFFTRYYTDYEPDHCFVAVARDRVVGYLIGCLRYRSYPWVQARIVAANLPRVIARAATGRYPRSSLRFLGWFVLKSGRQTPRTPPRSAHFHINLLPAWRDGRASRRLIFPFVRKLPEWGAERVYGQIQVYDDRRPTKVFERYGFRLFDQRRVTKFEPFGKTGVYVATVVREFEPA